MSKSRRLSVDDGGSAMAALVEADMVVGTVTAGWCPPCPPRISFRPVVRPNESAASVVDGTASALLLRLTPFDLGGTSSEALAEVPCARFGLTFADAPGLLFDELLLLNAIGSGGRNASLHRGQSDFLASCLRGT